MLKLGLDRVDSRDQRLVLFLKLGIFLSERAEVKFERFLLMFKLGGLVIQRIELLIKIFFFLGEV